MTAHLPLRPVLALLCCAAAGLPLPLSAQALKPSAQLNRPAAAPQAQQTRTVDYIVALVNSEPITNFEVRQRLLRVEQQFTQQGVALPARDELQKQVLEQLVLERAQLQQAKAQGIRVDDATLAQAEQGIAAQNQLSVEDFRRRAAAEGLDINRLREELRNQILLQRLREREIESRVRVSENRNRRFPARAQGKQCRRRPGAEPGPRAGAGARRRERSARARTAGQGPGGGGPGARGCRFRRPGARIFRRSRADQRRPVRHAPGLASARAVCGCHAQPGARRRGRPAAQPGRLSRAQADRKTRRRPGPERGAEPRTPHPAASWSPAEPGTRPGAAGPDAPANRWRQGDVRGPGARQQPGRLGQRRR